MTAIHMFELEFTRNNLDLPVVVRLKNKEQGMRFAQLIEREVGELGPKAKWKPSISYIEVLAIRFVWPMPEVG